MTLRQEIPVGVNRSHVFASNPSHTTLVAVNANKISVVCDCCNTHTCWLTAAGPWINMCH
jgi:hypothetical protein